MHTERGMPGLLKLHSFDHLHSKDHHDHLDDHHHDDHPHDTPLIPSKSGTPLSIMRPDVIKPDEIPSQNQQKIEKDTPNSQTSIPVDIKEIKSPIEIKKTKKILHITSETVQLPIEGSSPRPIISPVSTLFGIEELEQKNAVKTEHHKIEHEDPIFEDLEDHHELHPTHKKITDRPDSVISTKKITKKPIHVSKSNRAFY